MSKLSKHEKIVYEPNAYTLTGACKRRHIDDNFALSYIGYIFSDVYAQYFITKKVYLQVFRTTDITTYFLHLITK